MIYLVIQERAELVNAPKEIVQELKDNLTLQNPEYIKAKIYGRWIGKKTPRYLEYFKLKKRSIIFPRGYYRKCINILKKNNLPFQIVNKTKPLAEKNLQFNGDLREYQEIAQKRVLKKDMGVLIAPTGSGKTIMGISIICERKQPTLILVHTRELLYQWKDRIESFTNVSPGLIGDGNFKIEPITIGIVNSVKNKLENIKDHFGHLVVDECHRVPSTTFTKIVVNFDCKYILGLSGTAYRNDKDMTKLIFFFLGNRVHEIQQKQLEESKAILKPIYEQISTNFFYKYRNDYSSMISALTKDSQRNNRIAADIIEEVKQAKGTILVVSDRVYHCKILKEIIGEQVKTELLTAAVKNRTEIINKVRGGGVEVLISTLQLIGEGFDCHGLCSLFLTTPIKFKGRLRQVVGRILRPEEGKVARVFDYVDSQIDVLWKSGVARKNEMES